MSHTFGTPGCQCSLVFSRLGTVRLLEFSVAPRLCVCRDSLWFSDNCVKIRGADRQFWRSE